MREAFKKQSSNSAVFLDRDGVLNQDHGYVYRPEDFDWMPGAKRAVKLLNSLEMPVIVITNQSGIARGYYTEEQFHALTDWMRKELASAGAHLDDIFFCPHHPQGPPDEDRGVCRCRKPAPGMILAAAEKWNLDLKSSHLIGDKESDLEAGAQAGISNLHLFEGGNLYDFLKERLQV